VKLRSLYTEEVAPQGPSSPEKPTRLGDIEKKQSDYDEEAERFLDPFRKEVKRAEDNLKLKVPKMQSGTDARKKAEQAILAFKDLVAQAEPKGPLHQAVIPALMATREKDDTKEADTNYKTGGLGI
jgi:hypothetical protein